MNCACNRYKTCVECRSAYKESLKREKTMTPEEDVKRIEIVVNNILHSKEMEQKNKELKRIETVTEFCLSWRFIVISMMIGGFGFVLGLLFWRLMLQ